MVSKEIAITQNGNPPQKPAKPDEILHANPIMNVNNRPVAMNDMIIFVFLENIGFSNYSRF